MSRTVEWLETDGLGGFAMGTSSLIPTRRYHSLLTTSQHPPTHRFTLVNSIEAFAVVGGKPFALSSFLYGNGVLYPDGSSRIIHFDHTPWPTWVFSLAQGVRIRFELFMRRGSSMVVLSWKQEAGPITATLRVRPLLSVRDYHGLHQANSHFSFVAQQMGNRINWDPYAGCPGVTAYSNGNYTHKPDWYHQFKYTEEEARGYPAHEDLASPGEFEWDLKEEAFLLFIGHRDKSLARCQEASAQVVGKEFREEERLRRAGFSSSLERSADAYIVKRDGGKTIIAGYPWFTDWGRDTFIALRGLCIATKRFDDAKEILELWARTISNGTIPNVFPDRTTTPRYNSVDASLWFAISAYEYLTQAPTVTEDSRHLLLSSIEKILTAYTHGTRFKIRVNGDGLLAAGLTGTQLTWMDAKYGEHVVTPRIGKPVEVQALWLNALYFASELGIGAVWKEAYERGLASFHEKFWNESTQHLYDVVDVGHELGVHDPSLRPNQLFAVGGLPLQLIQGERAKQIIERVEHSLLTPHGIRTLSPHDPAYCPRYEGTLLERDKAYHQGTAWLWLIGPFIEGWLRVHGNTPEKKREAERMFLAPLLRTLSSGTLDHLAEIADGTPPHLLKGGPAQAWSLSEVLRLKLSVLV